MAANTQTQVDLKVAPKIAFGFSSKVGTLSSAILGVCTAVDAVIHEGALTPEGFATLGGAVLVLMSVIGIRGAQAAAAIKAVGDQGKAPVIVTSAQPQQVQVPLGTSVNPIGSGPQSSGRMMVGKITVSDLRANQEMEREPDYEPPVDDEDSQVPESERRDIHEADEKLEG